MAYRRGRYYYRSRRVGGRVVTEYLGAGQGAEQIAAMEARRGPGLRPSPGVRVVSGSSVGGPQRAASSWRLRQRRGM